VAKIIGKITLVVNYANVSYNENAYGSQYGWNLGGITGPMYGGEAEVIKCINYGTVTGTHNVGGIASTGSGTISLCSNYGHIKGDLAGESNTSIGGIIGYASGALDDTSTDGADTLIIENSYNVGTIELSDDALISTTTVGGVASFASNYTDARISFINCYSTGEIIADGINSVGGFIGTYVNPSNGELLFTNCYWTPECGTEYSMKGGSRRDEILTIPTDMATFKTNLGENYVEAEDNGYPILAWQNEYVEF